jgi:HSP20 family protein
MLPAREEAYGLPGRLTLKIINYKEKRRYEIMSLVCWAPIFPSRDEWDKFFASSGFVPALDIYQTKEAVVVEASLAGLEPDKVNISIQNDVLTIAGKLEHKSEVDEENYYRKEVRLGAFHRSVPLPIPVVGEKAQATYKNGILKIEIPKDERAKPKAVKIAVKE